jgi:aryl-alcohol dehydrogenase-like predicted oxidoreductase
MRSLLPCVALPQTNLSVTRIGLGTYNFGAVTRTDEADRIFRVYREHGGNLIDTANSYHAGLSEEIVGRLICGAREEFVVASKVGWPLSADPDSGGLASKHLIEQCELSLRRLGTDYIDLYQFHRPDPRTPIEETLRAAERLVTQGKVRHIGSSMFSVSRLTEALDLAERFQLPRLVAEQPPYNILDRRAEVELFPFCRQSKIAILVWSPLAGGILTGKYTSLDQLPSGSRVQRDPIYRQKKRLTEQAIQIATALADIASAWNLTAAQLAVAWVLWNPAVSCALAGPRKAEHLEELLSVGELPVIPELARFIDVLSGPGRNVSAYYDVL